MEGWQIALLIKPFALLVFFAVIVIPIELLLAKFWPEGRLKHVLFDRTFRDRHPGKFMIVWAVLMVLLWGGIYFVFIRGSGVI